MTIDARAEPVVVKELWASVRKLDGRRWRTTTLGIGKRGTVAIVLHDNSVLLWRRDQVKVVALLSASPKEGYPISAIAVDDDASLAAIGLDDKIVLVDLDSSAMSTLRLELPRGQHPAWVSAVAFASSSELVSAHFDAERSTILRWSVGRSSSPCPGELHDSSHAPRICPSTLLGVVPGFVSSMTIAEDQIIASSAPFGGEAAEGHVWFLAREPRGPVFREIVRGSAEESKIKLLAAETEQLRVTSTQAGRTVTATNDGVRVVTAGAVTPRLLGRGQRFHHAAVGATWIAGMAESRLIVWHSIDSAPIEVSTQVGTVSERTSTRIGRYGFSTSSRSGAPPPLIRGGDRLAWDDGRRIFVTTPSDSTPTAVGPIVCDPIHDYAISPDGRWLIAACGRQMTYLRAWDLRWRVPLDLGVDAMFAYVSSIVFSPDGSYVYVGDDPWFAIDLRIASWPAAMCATVNRAVVVDVAPYMMIQEVTSDGCGDPISR